MRTVQEEAALLTGRKSFYEATLDDAERMAFAEMGPACVRAAQAPSATAGARTWAALRTLVRLEALAAAALGRAEASEAELRALFDAGVASGLIDATTLDRATAAAYLRDRVARRSDARPRLAG